MRLVKWLGIAGLALSAGAHAQGYPTKPIYLYIPFAAGGPTDTLGRNLAQAMGAEGVRVEALSDVGPALRAAAKAQAEGKTTVLEMMVTRELGDPFRRDALAMPTRHLAKYKPTAA